MNEKTIDRNYTHGSHNLGCEMYGHAFGETVLKISDKFRIVRCRVCKKYLHLEKTEYAILPDTELITEIDDENTKIFDDRENENTDTP